MAFMDNETGEIVMSSHQLECNLDAETGECVGNESETEMEPKTSNIRKTKFNVPKAYLVQLEPPKKKEKCCLDQQQTFTLTSKKRVMELKEVTYALVRQFRNCNIQCFPISEHYPRLQQNESQTVPHSVAVHVSTLCGNRASDNRNHTSRMESFKEYKER